MSAVTHSGARPPTSAPAASEATTEPADAAAPRYALEVDGLAKAFGEKQAVRGLSFRARRGTVFALLGPNGAGKTTTIDICEGFQRPDSGSVRVLGIDPTTHPEVVRARIGIMLQGGGSYSGIRVAEMLRLCATYNQSPLDPDWLLDVVGLRRLARSTYRRLSGGEQQRLSLALAIIGRPELVFLDEPTAGLDAQSRLRVWELISCLRRDGVTVVLTTHLMDEAESLADDVAIVQDGRLIAAGTPQSLTDAGTACVHLQTSAAVDCRRLAAATGVAPEAITSARPHEYTVNAEPTPALLAALTAELAGQEVLLRNLDVSHRRLEDVFLDLTGRELRN